MSFQELRPGETFCFSCHPDIPCFNACCRDLNQYLTPYDIVRLKNNLGLSSRQFLQRYTECHRGPRSSLPVVSLRMPATCPFVSSRGCAVYGDRPGACRTYPLGRIVRRKPGEGECTESYFVIREPHCLGFKEDKTWTLEAWKKSQRLEPYNRMNDLMMEIISLNNQSKRELNREEADLFYMACYDLDRFRDFAFKKGLWKETLLEIEHPGTALEEDVALMRFGMDWIKKRLFGVWKPAPESPDSLEVANGTERQSRSGTRGD